MILSGSRDEEGERQAREKEREREEKVICPGGLFNFGDDAVRVSDADEEVSHTRYSSSSSTTSPILHHGTTLHVLP
jgi:hypothetical protein